MQTKYVEAPYEKLPTDNKLFIETLRTHGRYGNEKRVAETGYVDAPYESELCCDIQVQGDEYFKCSVCLSNFRCCIRLPCWHLSTCVACARAVCHDETTGAKKIGEVKLPKCMQDVTDILRTF